MRYAARLRCSTGSEADDLFEGDLLGCCVSQAGS